MGTKTRSLGLSSLVVTSLDKGAYEELVTNGWQVPENPIKSPPPLFKGCETIVPSAKLLRAVSLSRTPITKEKIKVDVSLPVHSRQVRKESSGWRRKWTRRVLAIEKNMLVLYKTETSKSSYKVIHLNDILKIEERTQPQPADSDVRYLFAIVAKKTDGKSSSAVNTSFSDRDTFEWCFAASSEAERDEWRSVIATRALVEDIISGSSATKSTARLQHLISDCGANLEFLVAEKTPLVLFALWQSRKDVVASLLRKGVDARCLLRLDQRTRSVITPSEVVNLLEVTSRDLNLTGDDETIDLSLRSTLEEEGGWSLLHHFVARRENEAIARLLQRIDRPTLNLTTNGGDTALTLAVKCLGDDDDAENGITKVIDIVRLLLEHGADPNIACASGDTAYHIVCKRGTKVPPQLSTILEDSHALDVNRPDAFGDTPLHIMLKLSQMPSAKRLANDSRINVNLRDSNGDPTLVLAMKLNEESFACFLLSKNADGSVRGVPSATSPRYGGRRTDATFILPNTPSSTRAVAAPSVPQPSPDYPIHLAIKSHMTSLALKLVEKLPVSSLIIADGNGRTPLLLSILHSLLGVSHAIVAKMNHDSYRHHLNDQDFMTKDTATNLAIRAGRVELTNSLLDAGVDIGMRNAKGETAIHVCARFVERTYSNSGGYTALKLFNRLIDSDAKRGTSSCINIPTFSVDKVPEGSLRDSALRCAKGCRSQLGAQPVIHHAASCENEQCGLWLLEALFRSPVISLESLDGAGLTPLACAIESRNAEICKLLVAKSQINRLVGVGNESYLHLALRQINQQLPGSERLVSVIDMLLAYGAYAGYWDHEGNTPLHLACSHSRYLAALKVLLKDRDIIAHRLNDRTETSGLTPIMIAVKMSKSPELVDLLLESGVDLRLVEPRTRCGLFRMCLAEGYDSSPENQAICVRLIQRIPESQLIEGSEDEWKARRFLAEKHAALLSAAEALEQERQQQLLPQPVPFMVEGSTATSHISQQRQVTPDVNTNRRTSSSAGEIQYSLASNPILECNERLSLAATAKKVVADSTRGLGGSKRSLEHKEDMDDAQEAAKLEITVATKKKPGNMTGMTSERDSELDQKLGESYLEDDVEPSDQESDDGPQPRAICHRLSQLDRILAFERCRADALETAKAWLESDNGKKMIAQVANVLISENHEHMTSEAALELARRNFIEEHVKDSLADFQEKFAQGDVSSDEKEQSM